MTLMEVLHRFVLFLLNVGVQMTLLQHMWTGSEYSPHPRRQAPFSLCRL